LHHEDGSFQEFIALDAGYLTILPDDVDPVVIGPVLCAGVTAYKVGGSVTFIVAICLKMLIVYVGSVEYQY
jgi:hypothetical protein